MGFLSSVYRSHTCNELRRTDVGARVTLSGWVARKRDHGGVIFVDLRDNYGVTQAVFSGDLRAAIDAVRLESVVQVTGEVLARAAQLVNQKLSTGEIEVGAATLEVLSNSDVLPFQVAEDDQAPEPLRLKHRFLELRRDKLHQNIVLRSRVIQAMREEMHAMGFLEFQTPILTSSSPEGARDFIVPSRLHPGRFFALPQAPQQFKQLLMVSGFDRYFQIAPCFRDEDARADRTPGEFYQLDMEMSFVEENDVMTANERWLAAVFKKFSTRQVTQTPFPRIKYADALSRYGTDKPDLRIPLTIEDVSGAFKDSEFRVFKGALEKGGSIRAILLPVQTVPPRKYSDDTVEYFTGLCGQGLAYLSFEGDSFKGSIGKFVTAEQAARLREQLAIKGTAAVFLAAIPEKAEEKKLLGALGRLRVKLGQDYSLVEKDAYRFCWITDMPFYEKDEETGAVVFGHNPFSMPQGGLDALNSKPPLEIPAHQYDVVCNGYELASGAIRNHLPELMYRAFEIVGYSRQHVEEKFGGMVKAFTYGAPPHGGMGFGIDRIIMLLAQEEAIREVIAFPLTQSAEDLLMGAPSNVSERQLKEVHIQLRLPPPKEKVGNA